MMELITWARLVLLMHEWRDIANNATQALWRRRVRSFSAPEPAMAAAAPSRQPDTQLSGQHSDLNERWTAALSTAGPAHAAALRS